MKRILPCLLCGFVATSAYAQQELRSVSPACQEDDVICKTYDYYSADTAPAHLRSFTKKHIEDGVVTLKELFYHDNPRQNWLKLNGYPESIEASSGLPKGSVTVAVASRSDTEMPLVSPSCAVANPPSNCRELNLRADIIIEGQALFTFYNIGYFGDIDSWLARNGLKGQGITVNSLVPIYPGARIIWMR